MTPITLLCPKLSCRAILRVPDTSRGQRVRCDNCQTAFLVPQKKKQDQKSATGTNPSKP